MNLWLGVMVVKLYSKLENLSVRVIRSNDLFLPTFNRKVGMIFYN